MKKLLLVCGISLLMCITACISPVQKGEIESVNEEDESVSVEEEVNNYTIEYYDDIDATIPAEKTTQAVSGVKTTLLSVDELGFDKVNRSFAGWRLYRDLDNTWYLRCPDGKSRWLSLENGELPNGYSYSLREDGSTTTSPTTGGKLKLYAQWGYSYTIEYYPDIDSESPSDYTTNAMSGSEVTFLTIEELGFGTDEDSFEGWRLYRDSDNKWYVKNADGNSLWYSLEDNKLPEGYSYSLRNDGSTTTWPTMGGVLRLYAQWDK